MGFLSRFDILSGITQRWACPPMNTYINFLNEKKKKLKLGGVWAPKHWRVGNPNNEQALTSHHLKPNNH